MAVPALRRFALNVRPGGVGSRFPTWEAGVGVGGGGCRRSVSLCTFAPAGGYFFEFFFVSGRNDQPLLGEKPTCLVRKKCHSASISHPTGRKT